MLKHRHTVFCENAILMADGRTFLAGLYPGIVVAPAPGPGVAIAIDIQMQFGSDGVGAFDTDIRIANVDGAVVGQFKQRMEFKEPHSFWNCTINKIVVPVMGPGYVKVSYRTDDTGWVEAGDVLIRTSPTVPAIPAQ